jgi:hypothetical protein
MYIIYVRVLFYVRAFVRACVHVCVCVCVSALIGARRMERELCVSIHTCMQTYTHARGQRTLRTCSSSSTQLTYIHAHTHTQVQISALQLRVCELEVQAESQLTNAERIQLTARCEELEKLERSVRMDFERALAGESM